MDEAADDADGGGSDGSSWGDREGSGDRNADDGDNGGDHAVAFELLADETRLGILRALAERQREAPRERRLSFSALRERVGTRDSGNFNYHLDRLQDRFVTKDDGGYRLTYAGMAVVGAILSGAYADHEPRGPVDLGEDCPACGEPLAATHEGSAFRVACPNDHVFPRNVFPPGGIEGRTMREAARLLARSTRQDMELVAEGACPLCYGPIELSVDAFDVPAGPETMHMFDGTCGRCGAHFRAAPGFLVAGHPAVVSLYDDHGVDIRARPLWTLSFCTEPATVVSEDPLCLRIEVELGGDELWLILDGEATVVDRERR